MSVFFFISPEESTPPPKKCFFDIQLATMIFLCTYPRHYSIHQQSSSHAICQLTVVKINIWQRLLLCVCTVVFNYELAMTKRSAHTIVFWELICFIKYACSVKFSSILMLGDDLNHINTDSGMQLFHVSMAENTIYCLMLWELS